MPEASPIPAKRPSTADTRPMTSASRTMPPSTCRRVAPTARSSATSRRRCATSTLKVFQMTKEPTRRETPANTSRMFVNSLSPSRTAADPSSASCLPVSASAPSGSTRATSCTEVFGVNPTVGGNSDLVDLAHLVEHLLCGPRLEGCERRPGHAVVLSEAGDPRDRERLGAALEHDGHPVPDAVARLAALLASRATSPAPLGARPER